MSNLKKILSENFVIVGEAMIPRDLERYIKEQPLGKNGWMKKTINFGIKVSDLNKPYVNQEAGYWSDEAIERTKNETGKDERGKDKRKQNWVYNGEMVDGKWVPDNIPFDKRFDQEMIDKVDYGKKIRVALEPKTENGEIIKDTDGNIECIEKEFLFIGDAIDYIKQHLKNGDRIYVYGKTEINQYISKHDNQLKINLNRRINQIRLARQDEDNQAVGTTNFYFEKDSFDKDEFKKERKYYIHGFRTIKNDDKIVVPVPITYILDFSNPNVDWDNEEIKERVEYLTDVFESKIKKDNVYLTTWRYMIFEGNNEVELTEKDLSKDLKKRVKLGFITLEDAIKQMRGSAVGDKIKELRLVMPVGESDKEEIEDLTTDDLIPPKIENKTDEIQKKINQEKKKTEEKVVKDVSKDFDAMFKK